MGLPLLLLNLADEEIERKLGGAFECFEETVFSAIDEPGMGYLVGYNLIRWKAKVGG